MDLFFTGRVRPAVRGCEEYVMLRARPWDCGYLVYELSENLGGNMVKPAKKKSPAKGSRTSFRAMKKQAEARVAAEKAPTKRASAKAPTTLIGREARTEERFRELVAWYRLQGLDEATAQRRAHGEIE
jgi:hypothetical protein